MIPSDSGRTAIVDNCILVALRLVGVVEVGAMNSDGVRLDGGTYRRAQHAQGGTVEITTPFTATLDLHALLIR